jgi:YHS domain-containing protein
MKRLLVSVLLSVIVFATYGQRSEIFAPNGKAIKGYDPVAFFNISKAVLGSDSLAYHYKGATWIFSSRENLNLFKASPGQYAPQFGGYCAYGMADGHKAPTETDTWSIVEGKLYFNYNQKVKSSWLKDQPEFIKKANVNWPLLKDKE